MSTRVTSTNITHRAKQKVLQLLNKNGSNSPSSIKHTTLRSEYLKRLQEIHPDKLLLLSNNEKNIYDQSTSTSTISDKLCKKDFIHKRFIELQSAWNDYEKVFKLTGKINDHSSNEQEEEADFTMFGVGCSFSDTPEERENRWKITDEACRGWFTSGVISERSSSSSSSSSSFKKEKQSYGSTSLIDNDMFIEQQPQQDSNIECSNNKRNVKGRSSSRKHLLDLPKQKKS